MPCLREQINIALCYHCKEGDLKWVSLMLWAGADPYAKGQDSPHDDPDLYTSALELAALYGHLDISKLKKIRLNFTHQATSDLLWNACHNDNSAILKLFLEEGFDPKNLQDKGSSLIHSLLYGMGCDYDFFSQSRKKKDVDTSSPREKIKMIHMLARHGARWVPESSDCVNNARRLLLKMRHDYVMEFIRIMSEYKACTYETVEAPMKTPAIRSLVSNQVNSFNELMESFHDYS